MFDIFGTRKEGPGVYLDTPRKKGLGRFLEIFTRDWGPFYGSAFLATLAFIPGACGMLVTVLSKNLFWGIIFGIVGGMIASPFYAVLVDTILRAQRDEPGYWWVRYRKAFRNNLKASLIPGAIWGVFFNIQAISVFVLLPANPKPAMLISVVLSTVVSSFLLLWVYPQIVLFDMPLFKILRNAAILSFSQLPRSFGATVFILAYWGAAFLFFPMSVMVFFLTTLWLPTFAGLSFIYVPLNKTFEIEKLVEEKRAEEAAKEPRYYSKENNF